jgi:predicted HicB family RNase H-like nuclease
MAMISKKQKSNAFPLRLPLTLRRQVEELASKEGISINQFISLALAERVILLEHYLHTCELPSSLITPVC